MAKFIFVLVTIMFFSSFSLAAEVNLKWDASAGATGYKIYKSIDQGVTWSTGVDVGNVVTFKVLNVEETVLVLFRVSAYNLTGEVIRTEYGAWFDNRKKPPANPSGLGVN